MLYELYTLLRSFFPCKVHVDNRFACMQLAKKLLNIALHLCI